MQIILRNISIGEIALGGEPSEATDFVRSFASLSGQNPLSLPAASELIAPQVSPAVEAAAATAKTTPLLSSCDRSQGAIVLASPHAIVEVPPPIAPSLERRLAMATSEMPPLLAPSVAARSPTKLQSFSQGQSDTGFVRTSERRSVLVNKSSSSWKIDRWDVFMVGVMLAIVGWQVWTRGWIHLPEAARAKISTPASTPKPTPTPTPKPKATSPPPAGSLLPVPAVPGI